MDAPYPPNHKQPPSIGLGKTNSQTKDAECRISSYERRLLFKLIWKAAFVWVTPYLVQLTFSLEACSWKNGDLVFQRWSFFSILETCMGIDDPYVKKPRWRRNWNAISKMIKDGLAEGMVTRKLCVEVLDLVFDLVSDLVFFRASWIETCQLD